MPAVADLTANNRLRGVAEQVRDAREAAGLSQRALASRMGTSQAAIARLEAGGVGSTLTTLQRVATALQLEVSVNLRALGVTSRQGRPAT